MRQTYKKAPRPDIAQTLCLLVLIAILALPFHHVGILTPEGYAYRAYFDHDFLVHRAVTAELSHGDMPPHNPYFASETLHYYWLAFQTPALVHQLADGIVSLEPILLYFNFTIAVCFFYMLQLSFRIYSPCRFMSLITAGILLLFGSYEGIALLFKLSQNNEKISQFTAYNIDGLTRWLYGPPQIDALLRSLFYTPQHLTAICLFLCLFIISILSRRSHTSSNQDLRIAFVVLVSIVGCSAFIGIACFAFYYLNLVFQSFEEKNSYWRNWLISICAVVLGFMMFSQLGMIIFAPSSQLNIQFQFADPASCLKILFLNFGPIAPLAAIGVVLAIFRRDRIALTTALPMTALAFFFITYLSIPDYVNEFGLRGGFLFIVFAGFFMLDFLNFIVSFKKPWKASFIILTAFVILPAGLTTIFDIYNMQDTTNTQFTTYISQPLRNSLEWLRNNTSSRDVMQEPPQIFSQDRSSVLPNFIPPFAERRLAVGKPYYAGQFQIGGKIAGERVKEIEDLINSSFRYDLLDPKYNHGIRYWLLDIEHTKPNVQGLEKYLDERICARPFSEEKITVFEPVADRIPRPVRETIDQKTESFRFESSGAAAISVTKDRSVADERIRQYSGFTSRRIYHDWIFSPGDFKFSDCLLGVRNPCTLKIASAESIKSIRFDMFYFSCNHLEPQWTNVYLDDELLASFQVSSGWMQYEASVHKSDYGDDFKSSLLTFVFKNFRNAKEVCVPEFNIGETSAMLKRPLFIRAGPAPREGYFNDLIYDGKNYAGQHFGYTFLGIDEDGVIIKKYNFALESGHGQDFVKWIDEMKAGMVVAGVGFGGSECGISEEIWRAMRTIGLSDESWRREFHGHGFIGVKGAIPGTALEILPGVSNDFINIGFNQGSQPITCGLANIQVITDD